MWRGGICPQYVRLLASTVAERLGFGAHEPESGGAMLLRDQRPFPSPRRAATLPA
jgi:hypothetical protein